MAANRFLLRWTRPVNELQQLATTLVTRYRDAIATLAQAPAQDTGAIWHAVQQLAKAEADVFTRTIEAVLPSVASSSDPAVRKASVEAKTQLKAVFGELTANVAVAERLQVLLDQWRQLGASVNLDEQDHRYVVRLVRECERAGSMLTPADRDALQKLRQRETELCATIEQTINEEDSTVRFTAAQLEGVPAGVLAGWDRDDKTDEYVLSLKAPSVVPVLTSCHVAETRKTMEQRRNQRCLENYPRKKHHADVMIDGRMCENADAALDFLQGIANRLLPAAVQQKEGLLAFKRTQEPQATTLEAWDLAYFQKLQLSRDECWHPEVRCFAVHDDSTDELLGHFFLDMHSRPGKYGHQCVMPIRPSCVRDGQQQTPIVAMIANFPRNTADQPALLRHSQVTTFFHEFGHVCHGVCTSSKYARFAWAWSIVPYPAGVEYDYLEVPSMMFENWTWDASVLRKLSCHFKTLAPLPDDAVERLIASRFHNKAWGELRYLYMAMADLRVHMKESDQPASVHTQSDFADPLQVYNELRLKYALLPAEPDANPWTAWYHPVMGYDAGYYSYAWSEAVATDLLQTFKERAGGSLLVPEQGAEIRRHILAPGATVDGKTMVKQYLGREPNFEPFVARMCE
ncbi:uncharacterized protein MONBRDRAFT_25656 [Monosiga brevicollis MX1]|uniref:Peptidase M3A/M3B catalytic domain-containing protein n=1 Tax=Monosiga brevicollis TaxID=81824 RepID=A9V015_MONBE|nr:uncharacterized protein MONBRDRAFT_25656 [Monosiga brevicollis MX1]EDQ89077.1 predicted protein [Monosiga brevicollis MX1]|eukprot:XP_001746182.1 hypothetical protein [Monosiga brevicollis MX1]